MIAKRGLVPKEAKGPATAEDSKPVDLGLVSAETKGPPPGEDLEPDGDQCLGNRSFPIVC